MCIPDESSGKNYGYIFAEVEFSPESLEITADENQDVTATNNYAKE